MSQRGAGESGLLWYLVPVGLLLAVLAVGAIVVATLNGAGSPTADPAKAAGGSKLPPYWTVREGDTFSQIAEESGLSVDTLQTFNPRTDPTTIVPGQRLKLRLHAPRPKPKPLGPRFWKVKPGQSFGSIAAATGRSIGSLQRLNPRLKPTQLQVGDRVRLRR